MKKLLILLAFLVASFLFWSKPNHDSFNEIQNVGKILLSELKLEYNQTPDGIHKALQHYFLRPSDKERWEFKSPYENKNNELIPILKKFNLLNAVYPTQNEYSQIIFYGSLIESMKIKADFLKEQIEKGLKIKNIFVLLGERPLKESEKKFLKENYSKEDISKVKTEADGAKIIFNDQIKDIIDSSFTHIIYVIVPMLKNDDGNIRRPNTHDTVEKLITFPEFKVDESTLLISHAPFIQFQKSVYQYAIYKKLKKLPSSLDAGGPMSTSSNKVGILLDTITRTEDNLYKIYQLNALQ
jgi:hypothetical protein